MNDDMEDSTAYVRRITTAIYYIKAIDDSVKCLALLPKHKDHGKRGKKGKTNKDWHK
jgi:hypothetical protein